MGENFSKLPKGWAWAAIGEIANKINPGFPTGRHNKEKRGIPHLRPMNISSKGEIDLSDIKYIEEKEYDPLMKGDVLFNNTNSPELLGKTSYVRQDTNWGYSNHMTRIRVDRNFLNPAWIAYALHKFYLDGFFKMNCIHHVNQASINTGFLSNKVIIPIPPLPEQHRIVAKIEELFTRLGAGVEALKKVKAQLKRYRQAVLKYAFEGKLTQEWREANKDKLEPASVLLERIKEERKKKEGEKFKALPPVDTTDLTELPEGWEWARIGEIADVVRGASPRPAGHPKYFGGNIPWITVGEITKDKNPYLRFVTNFVTEEGKERSRYIEPATFLLTNSGATLGVPKITLIGGCINDGSVAFLDLNENMKLFLYYFLSSQTKKLRQVNQGAAQPNLNTSIVKNIIAPLTSLNEQAQIVSEIETRFSMADEVEMIAEQTLKQSDKLRQSILKSAFEGNLVPQDPTDEPAEKLLERIKNEKLTQAKEGKMRFDRRKRYEQKAG